MFELKQASTRTPRKDKDQRCFSSFNRSALLSEGASSYCYPINFSLTNGEKFMTLTVLQSKQKGKKNEAIATTLEAGSYFLKIAPGSPQDQTKYRLQLSGAPTNSVPGSASNTAPVLAVNIPLSLAKGTPVIFNGNLLKATDAEQNSSQLVYTLTRLPEAGLLKLNGDRLKAGGTFTQADIDGGSLVYNSRGATND